MDETLMCQAITQHGTGGTACRNTSTEGDGMKPLGEFTWEMQGNG